MPLPSAPPPRTSLRTNLKIKFEVDGEARHVHGEPAAGDPAVVEADDLALGDDRRGDTKASHQAHREHGHPPRHADLAGGRSGW